MSANNSQWVDLPEARRPERTAVHRKPKDGNYSTAKDDIRGKTLTVAYDTLDPYVMFRGPREVRHLSGYLVELWRNFEDALGFRSEFVRAGGQAARMMLRSGSADVYLQPTVVSLQDAAELDHTLPVANHWYQLFVRSGNTEVSADSYIRAMSSNMWVLTAATLGLLAAMLWATESLRLRLGLGSGMSYPPGSPPEETVSVGSLLLTVLGGLCSQGWQEAPQCSSLRALAMTALLFGYLVYNAYAAVLVSYLAAGRQGTSFADLEEVAARGTHTLCMRNESYAYSTYKGLGRFRKILNKGPCRGLARPEQVAVALCEHDTAILEIPSVMAAILNLRPTCLAEIGKVRGKYCRASVSLLLRKGFPYTHAIDYIILRGRSTGMIDRLEQEYFPPNLGDPTTSNGQDAPGTPSFMQEYW